MNRNFVDLSSNNGPAALDAKAYAAAGHVLIAIKATDGAGYVNPDWQAQTHVAHEARVPVLHYHFAEKVGSAVSQGRFFLTHLTTSGEYHPYDAIALDIEREQGISDPVAFIRSFDGYCRAHGFKNLIVYSEASYFVEHGVGMKPHNGRLWVADYGAALPAGFTRGGTFGTPWARQFTDSARVSGIVGPVDNSTMCLSAYLYHRTHRPR
jgi:GH25 family lysozyme M1 (1,4-beta-N-acetylmuramidase)